MKIKRSFRSLLFILILSTINHFPQMRIGSQGSVAIPAGFFEDAVDVGFGTNVNFSTTVLYSNFELTGSIGYYKCGFKEDLPDYNFKFETIPLLIGARFNFTDVDFIPYVGFDAGLYHSKYYLEIDYGLLGTLSAKETENKFGFSPVVGFRMNMTPFFDVDVNARYNRIRTKYIARAFVSIQAGIAFRI
ncbi:MAG: outer membrane beta-barrel protein [Ignavibacteria bacterium]|nr:outer membrane beta-barrel protein [Ignavibacteria bacterium]